MSKRPSSNLIFCLLALLVLASCARGSEGFYFGNYSEAEKHYNKGEYEKAIQKYQAYLDEQPDGNLAVISQYYMAKSHAALGHKEEAAGLYKKIVQEHPDLIWANFSENQLKELEGTADQPEGGPVEDKAAPEPKSAENTV